MSNGAEQPRVHEATLIGLTEHLGIGGLASVLHAAACRQRSGLEGVTLSQQGDEGRPAYALAIRRDTSDIAFNGDGPHPVPTQALYERLAAMAAPELED
ncbi:MAG TPA: hypothetical protein VLF43_04925 [Candidatus Saccharimonadales bacterium]|nr:hypothetical protein [Candidatus Saccharimonadales bacterium]